LEDLLLISLEPRDSDPGNLAISDPAKKATDPVSLRIIKLSFSSPEIGRPGEVGASVHMYIYVHGAIHLPTEDTL
jgi:hypothetical protein